jgi:methionyl-tRNA formyltransferase
MIKILFFSSSSFCLPILQHIISNPKLYTLVGVVTQPNWENHGKIYYNPVAKFATENSLPIFQPDKINKNIDKLLEFATENKNCEIDVIVVASYGQIIGKEILEIPKFGCINWHPSLLPKYRGATPMQSAIYNQETKTGLSWIEMGVGMDDGKILLQKEFLLGQNSFLELANKMGDLGAKTLEEAINLQIDKQGISQDDTQVTLCTMLTKEDGRIEPKSTKASKLISHVLAFEQFPKTLIQTEKYGLVKILKISKIVLESIRSDDEDQNFFYHKGRAYLKAENGVVQVYQIQLENGRKISFVV